MTKKIETCKKCTNRTFDPKQGIVCGLTNNKPIFDDLCPDFEKDASVKEDVISSHIPNDHLGIYNKEFSIGEILSASWRSFIENFHSILAITLIVYIPINTLLYLIPVEESVDSFTSHLRISQLLEGLIGIISTMAVAFVVSSWIDGNPLTTREALRRSVSKWGSAFGTNILLGIFLLGLTILLIVPGIIYFVYWYFVIYAVALRNQSGRAALDYSKEMVEGRWWRVMGYGLLFGLLAIASVLIASTPYFLLSDNLLTNLITDTFVDILLSFFLVVATVFFINFDATKRSLHENWQDSSQPVKAN